ncbi:Dyp-type peroxidase [Aestuariimicrobium ganziense]|uniref:Dyp-type peroxidase n=1 Tax=Aestuariimicrobium ganziense TaxID=2773677 RepID=UPI0019403AAC|nr:Dyp-type peroxidase [Aestuariimicrobium ganziense]
MADPTPDLTDQPERDVAVEPGEAGRVESTPDVPPAGHALGRRRLLGHLGTAGVGLAAGAAAGWGLRPAPAQAAPVVIRQRYSPWGEHQTGITTPTPAATEIIAFDLLDGVDGDKLGRLLRLWSTDVAAAMRGRPIPGDVVPEMAQEAVSLTVTVGFGAKVFDLPGVTAPPPVGLTDIPAMNHDKLEARWGGGDLVVLVAADDPTTVAHVKRRLVVDAETFAKPRWVQTGSWRGTDGQGRAVTGRNMFGQVDGSANPKDDLLASTVWDTSTEWRGGTQLVIRRIEMDLEVWDTLTRERHDKAVGRRIQDGAPLTGGTEHDDVDLAATDEHGPVIALDAHARRSHPSQNGGRRILRRGLNYTHEEFVDGAWRSSAGLVFLSFQANTATQFVPIQQRLDQSDALNEWTHAVGSAVFAIAPGFNEGGWIGQGLFS